MANVLHEALIQELVNSGATRPVHHNKRKGFYPGIRKIAKQFDIDMEELESILYVGRVIPDVWRYDPCTTNPNFPGTFTAYEVSVTLAIKPERLINYAELWFSLDCIDIGLRLIEKTRTGEAEISLSGVYFECCSGKGKIDNRFWNSDYALPEELNLLAHHMGIDPRTNNTPPSPELLLAFSKELGKKMQEVLLDAQ